MPTRTEADWRDEHVTPDRAGVCPSCDGETVNGQGVFACPSREWTGIVADAVRERRPDG